MKKHILYLLATFSFLLYFSEGKSQTNTCQGTIQASDLAEYSAYTTIGNGTAGCLKVCITVNNLGTGKCSGNNEQVIVRNTAGSIVAQWFASTAAGTCVTLVTNDGFARLSKLCLTAGNNATITWETVNCSSGANVCCTPNASLCSNGVLDCGETAVDCGGACAPCASTGNPNYIGGAQLIDACGTSFSVTNAGADGAYSSTQAGCGTSLANLDCNTTTSYSGTAGNDVPWSIENDIWYKFCPSATGSWTVNISAPPCSNTGGYQYALFQGTPGNLHTQFFASACQQTQGMSCVMSMNGAQSTTINVTSITDCIYLVIDGHAGAVCDFSVSLTNVSGCALIAPGTTICSGETATITASGSGGTFKWYDAQTGGTLLFDGNPYTTPVLTTGATPTTISYWVSETKSGVEGARVESKVTVNPNAILTLTSAAGTNNQTRCINTAITNITYSVTGGGTGAGVTGLPAGVTGSFAGGIFTISGTPTASGTFNYTVTTTGTCTQATATGTITVNPNATIALTSAAGTNTQTRCVNAAITNITYAIGGGGTGAGVTGLPAGVTGSFSGGVFTISGTPSATGTFNYTVTTTGVCTQTSATGTITVNPNAAIALTSAAGTNNQTLCINNPITTITYSVTGGGTGAGVTGLPAGVTGSYSGGIFTISGTPTASGTFNYTVTTTGTCTQATATGTITVNPNATIALTSAAGTNTQTPCVNTAITNITYAIGGGGTGAGVTGLPTGVTGSFSGGVFTISGTPTATGTFNYTVTTTGVCTQTSATGTITVNPNAAIALTSAAGTNAQTLCINNPITTITYSVTGGGTGAGVTGLPAGVTGSYSGGIFTISGTPTASGTFNYTVTTTGTCTQATATGSIVVNPLPVITSTTKTDETTCGAGDGTITINATGSGLEYSINGGSSFVGTNVFNSLAAGSYSVVVRNAAGCSVSGGVVSISSASAPAMPSATASPNPLCAGTTLTLAVSSPDASLTYEWTGPGVSPSPATGPTITIPNVTTAMTGNYTVVAKNGACTSPGFSIAVTVNPNAAIALTSGAGTNAQTLCINNPITTITYSVTGGGTGAGVIGLPAGVTGSFAGGTFTISGTPTASGTFNYTVTTTGTCTQATATGTIIVNPNATITLTSAAGTNNQTRCVSTAITNITYAIGGGGTGAGVTGLPAGVTGSFSGGVFTISGTPTASGTFNYTVTTTGTCNQATASGTIIVNPNATISLTSAAGTNNQTLCINNAITNITYAIGGGGTGAGVTGLPAGVTGSFAGGNFSITGTPTASGTFNYTVTTTGTCTQATATGTIIVNPDATISLTSAAGTNAQEICLTASITNITYLVGGGGSGAGVTGLPAGVTGSFSGGTFTISGTPTETGLFNYTVTTTGACMQTTATGTITINPNAEIALTSAAGTDAQTLCINTAINTITYSVTGGGTGATVSGLPNGVIGSFAGNVFTISGSPTESGTFNYTVTTTGTCAQATETGSIIVNPDAAITLTSASGTDNQGTCNNTSITSITYTISGGGTGAGVTGLPAGVTGSFSGNTFTISGTPTSNGVFNYTVTTTGTCDQNAATGTITVNPLPTANVGDDKEICFGDSTFIGAVAITGNSYSWISDPAGFTSSESIPTVSPTVTTSFILTESVGSCSKTDTVVVTVTPLDDDGFAYSATSFCKTGTNPTPTTINLPGGTFTGSTGLSIDPSTGTIDLAATALGAYTVTYTTAGTCPNDSIITINITNPPTAGFSYDASYCKDASNPSPTMDAGATMGIFSATPAGLAFVDANTGEIDIAGSTPGSYKVYNTIAAAGGCAEVIDSVTVIINSLPTAFNITPASGSYCPGASGVEVGLDNSETGVNYQLLLNGTATGSPIAGTGAAISFGDQLAGTYTVLATNATTGCTFTMTGSAVITENNAPAISATATDASCGANDGTITASGNGTLPYTYSLNGATATPDSVFSGLGGGVYTIVIQDAGSCTGSTTVTVEQAGGPDAVFTATPTSGMAPLTVSLVNNSTGATSYEWHIMDTVMVVATSKDTSYVFQKQGSYSIKLLAYSSSCYDSAMITIEVMGASVIIIPNVFTPNGDGSNDQFKIRGENIAEFSGSIYNRWGKKLFEWADASIGWDGTSSSGEQMPEGTYYYMIRAVGTDGQVVESAKPFNLFR